MAFNLITGTEFDDDLSGTQGADSVRAGGGDDAVDGYDGNDIIHGEAGNDLISSGNGNDRVYGGDGNDRIWAGFAGGTDFDRVWGGSGDDQIHINSLTGAAIYGGAGFDVLVLGFFSASTGVSLALPQPGATISNPGGLVIASIEALVASTYLGDDSITGGRFADLIAVHTGANTVQALGGKDFVQYYTGSANVIDCGDGFDTLQVVNYVQDALLFTVTGTSASDNFGSTIINTERFEVFGNAGNDQVTLGDRADVFGGYGGDDLANGGAGKDSLHGGYGNDTLNGEAGDDRIFGQRGDDFLAGGQGADRISGGDGNDSLSGGTGRDTLVGGLGADVFVLEDPAGAADIVRDLVTGIDSVHVDSNRIGDLLPDGAVTGAHYYYDVPYGTGPQFLYVQDTETGLGRLYWDSNGEDAGGRTLLALFSGTPALAATDLLII